MKYVSIDMPNYLQVDYRWIQGCRSGSMKKSEIIKDFFLIIWIYYDNNNVKLSLKMNFQK